MQVKPDGTCMSSEVHYRRAILCLGERTLLKWTVSRPALLQEEILSLSSEAVDSTNISEKVIRDKASSQSRVLSLLAKHAEGLPWQSCG